MFRLLLPSVLCIACLTARALPAHGLRNVAELAALDETACASNLPFRIEGRIEATLANDSALVADNTDRTLVRMETAERPPAGSVVSLSGYTGLFAYSRQRQFIVTNAVTVGTEPPAASVSVAANEIIAGRCNYRLVTVSGTVTDVFADDVDKNWYYFVLRSGDTRVIVAVPAGSDGRLHPEDILNAEVSATGVVLPDHCGLRVFVGPHLELSNLSAVTVTSPPSSPFDVPALKIPDLRFRRPTEIAATGRRRGDGNVCAAWGDGNVLLQPHDDTYMRVRLIAGLALPPVGRTAEFVGQPETDAFHINLSRARWRENGKAFPATDDPNPRTLTPDRFRDAQSGRFCIDMLLHGRLVRFDGTVLASPASAADGGLRIPVDCGEFRIEYDICAMRNAAADLRPGARIRATGIVVVELDNWRPVSVFPTVKGVTVVSRSPDDVVILSKAPWWTPFRLAIVILSLVGALVVLSVLSYVLSRLVERRGQQLAAAKIVSAESSLKTVERTRLATELHDSISQTLTGVFLEIETARQLEGNRKSDLSRHLDVASNTLQSCRAELRNCLWDLRSQAIDEPDLATAVRRTLQPHLKGVTLDVRLDGISRQGLSETTLHAILQIVRELTVNAIRHGQATHVSVEGRRTDGGLSLTVTDDGAGFDVSHAPGLDDGHFGLQGIRERIRLVGGTFVLNSRIGQGTCASLTLPLPTDNAKR